MPRQVTAHPVGMKPQFPIRTSQQGSKAGGREGCCTSCSFEIHGAIVLFALQMWQNMTLTWTTKKEKRKERISFYHLYCYTFTDFMETGYDNTKKEQQIWTTSHKPRHWALVLAQPQTDYVILCKSLSCFALLSQSFFFSDQKVQPLPHVMSVYSPWQYTGLTTSVPTKINSSCKARDSAGFE